MVTLWEVTVVLPLGSRGSSARHTPVQSEPWRQLVLIQVKTSGQLNMQNVKHTIYQVDKTLLVLSCSSGICGRDDVYTK